VVGCSLHDPPGHSFEAYGGLSFLVSLLSASVSTAKFPFLTIHIVRLRMIEKTTELGLIATTGITCGVGVVMVSNAK
jgi:hypothetical protein